LTPADALKLFPAESEMAQLIGGLCSSDNASKERSYSRLNRGRISIQETEALAVVTILGELEFPPQEIDLFSSDHWTATLLQVLWENPFESLVVPLKEKYHQLPEKVHDDVLIVFAIIGSRKAAQAFMQCIDKDGIPSSSCPRLFAELPKLTQFGDLLFPKLLIEAGVRVAEIADMINQSLAAGLASIDRIAPANDFVVDQLTGLLDRMDHFDEILASENTDDDADDDADDHEADDESQTNDLEGSGDDEDSQEDAPVLIEKASALVQLAGRIGNATSTDVLVRALTYDDVTMKAEAALALMRLEVPVSQGLLAKLARAPLSRVCLYNGLAELDQLDKYPAKWLTWEAFAEADMAMWISHPAELGKEPERLEKKAHLITKVDGRETSIFVWRFKDDAEETWLAAISGPYQLEGDPRPVNGYCTFSDFQDWNEASPEEHAERMLRIFSEQDDQADMEDDED